MLDGFSISYIILLLGISYFVESTARPIDSFFSIKKPALLLHAFIFTGFYIIFLALSLRLYLAGALVICGQLLLIIISNAKYKALREPLVASDLILFTQAIKFPRLYLPFLGLVPAIVLPTVTGLAIYFLTTLETPLFQYSDLPDHIGVVLASLVFIATGLIVLSRSLTPSQLSSNDVQQFGLISNLLIYLTHTLQQQKTQLPSSLDKWKNVDRDSVINRKFPDIVVIQSESFFDVRRLHPSIHKDVLQNFDHCCDTSLFHGQLDVPAWGAYTMRTEYSFLTGQSNQSMGMNRFDPYLAFRNKQVFSIATYLKTLGYETICIHPNASEFFSRHILFPNLGIDRFIDISEFDITQKSGPYISDKAVTEKILATLAESNTPKFIFTITMENHGPLHLETDDPSVHSTVYADTPPEKSHDLNIYLRHLLNADIMIRELCEAFSEHHPDALLCWYGDHVPSMPDVYEELDFDQGETDYFIWNAGNSTTSEQAMSVEKLADLILSSGLVSPN